MPKSFYMGIDLKGQRALNLGDASGPTDAVTLQQLQAYVRGLSWKSAVRAASTGNVSLAAPGATIDGVTLQVGDRVLLKNQTTASQNGIYVWNGAAAALTRATDANTTALLTGASTLVTEGTTNADKAWTLNTDNVTVDTTSQIWVQFGGGGTTYTAGNGLTLSGSAFQVVAGSGIIADGTSTRVDPSVVVRKSAASIGNGAATVVTHVHNLGTTDFGYWLKDAATGAFVDTDAVATDLNTITYTFPSAPAASAYRSIVHA